MSNTRDDLKSISEDDCAVCGPWPEADRSSMRMLIDSLPLREVEQICDECLQAFWTNCVVGPRPKRARRTKHQSL